MVVTSIVDYLGRKSRVPPVCFATALTAASVDFESVTSRVNRVTFERSLSCDIFVVTLSRAVAKTSRPRCWKTSAKAGRSPPSLQPVIGTVSDGILKNANGSTTIGNGVSFTDVKFTDDEGFYRSAPWGFLIS